MSRFREITNQLKNIGSEEFAELCDLLLARIEKDVISFTRSGAQLGKPKPVKGIPDSHFLCPDGKFIFIEHTTVEKPFDKLKESIDSCFDFKKTKIKSTKIKKIILCFNSQLKPQELDSLLEYAITKNRHTQIIFYNIDTIADEINKEHSDLANQYLSLSLDKGQIISIKQFIEQYDKAPKGIATTLENKFLFREKESQDILNALIENDFVVITGAAGVGKTKITLECIERFLKANEEFSSYCFSNKDSDLIDDLNNYIKPNKNYILFVDDANRFDHLRQIIKFYDSPRSGHLKIIMTTRDYALHKVDFACTGFNYNKIFINGFTDEEIKGIIESDSFNIKNFDYQKEILRIANGNPRFAIMAAKLAIEKNIHSLYNVGDLFEDYFKTFLNDNKEIFSSKSILKTLGIIAFLGATPYLKREKIENILNIFEIEFEDFVQSISDLEKFELIQTQYGYAKIGEQNTATYFFYRAFVKDKLLSFELLLMNFFKNYSSNFTDTIFPVINLFGFENIQKEIVQNLKNVLEKNKSDKGFEFIFIKFFWFYMPETVLDYIYKILQKSTVVKNPIYIAEFENELHKHKSEEIIDLLGEFFIHHLNLQESLELAFEYIKRYPNNLPILIEKIKACFSFNHNDELYGFHKQNLLFDFLLNPVRTHDILFVKSFLSLASHFLEHSFRERGVSFRNTMYIGTYNLNATQYVKNIREKILRNINFIFSNFPDECLKILLDCAGPSPDTNKGLLEFDIPFLIKIFERNLSVINFEHCYVVQENIFWWKRKKIQNNIIEKLKEKFTNKTYQIYRKLNWDMLKDKAMFEYENLDTYENNKKLEIQRFFNFNSIDDFLEFYTHYIVIYKSKLAQNTKDYYFEKALDIILDTNFGNSADFGLQMINHILREGNPTGFRPYLTFEKNINNLKVKNELWNLLNKYEYKNKATWKIIFWQGLPANFITKEDVNCLINTFKEIDNSIYFVDFLNFSNYAKFDKNILNKLLKIIIGKVEKEKMHIRLENDFIVKYYDFLSYDFITLKKAYTLFNKPHEHFDYDGDNLALILRKDRKYLLEYVDFVLENYNNLEIHSFYNLSVVWQIPGIEKVLTKTFKSINKNDDHFYLEHFANAFFHNLKDSSAEKADNYILNFIKTESNNTKDINMFMDVINESRKDLREKAILTFLEFNQNLEDFKKIKWKKRERMYSGDTIIGDSRASEWNNLLNIVNKSNMGIKLLPIKKFIQDQINEERRGGEWERERKFVNPNW